MKIVNLSKRFRIIFYQLEKIMDNWGKCQGLSYNDVTELNFILDDIKAIYKKSLPFGNFYTYKPNPSRKIIKRKEKK